MQTCVYILVAHAHAHAHAQALAVHEPVEGAGLLALRRSSDFQREKSQPEKSFGASPRGILADSLLWWRSAPAAPNPKAGPLRHMHFFFKAVPWPL